MLPSRSASGRRFRSDQADGRGVPFAITITEFLFDDDNLDKIDRHRLSDRQLREVLESRVVVVRNRRSGRAPFIVLGRDRGGRCIAIPAGPTAVRSIWRPVTAWYCKESEEAQLQRRGG